MKISDKPVIVEETINVFIEEVWRSITEVNKMTKWFFENIPEFKPEVGFKTQFNIHSGGRDFLHLWEIVEVVPFRKISYKWQYKGYQGDSIVSFDLTPNDDSTLIKLTATVLEDFPDDIPEFKRESCVGGWEYFIKDRLKNYLENV